MSDLSAGERVLRIRREFDESFAAPAERQAAQRADVLAVRIGGDPYALPLDGIDGVLVDRVIVPVPATIASFLGLIGHRGSLIAVYDLAAILGGRAAASPRWIVLVRNAGEAVGFAFEVFEGQAGLDVTRPLIAISSLLAAIHRKE